MLDFDLSIRYYIHAGQPAKIERNKMARVVVNNTSIEILDGKHGGEYYSYLLLSDFAVKCFPWKPDSMNTQVDMNFLSGLISFDTDNQTSVMLQTLIRDYVNITPLEQHAEAMGNA